MNTVNTALFDLDKLKQGANHLGLSLTEQQFAQLVGYLTSLSLWNKKFNLTAITNPDEMLVKHVLDSMSILPFLPLNNEGSLLDVGTGAGLPGVIIAICQPNRHCTVLDSNSKKIRFIRQVVGELGLTNVTPTHERIENLSEHGQQFDVITSRAFASLVDFVTVVKPVLKQTGSIQAMKGVVPTQEMKTLQENWQIETQKLTVPFLSDERHLIQLTGKL